MTQNETGEPAEEEERAGRSLSRRTFLGGTAVLGVAPALRTGDDRTGRAQTDDESVDVHIELGAEIEGWMGRSPSEIEGETNPVLDLEPGTEYGVTWENLDGVQHNFAILDADGVEIESTEIMSIQGETRSLTFTATREMDQYYCAVHTNRMRGDVQVGDGAPTDDEPVEDDPDDDSAEDDPVETVYELGGVIGGWQGRLPEERDAENRIDGEENPTLEFEAGARYMVKWENADGVPHNFTIQDADENSLIATETTEKQGEMLSLTFTASEEMAQYVCTIHPETMQGDLRVSGNGVGRVLPQRPQRLVGGLIAVTAAVVGGLGYALSEYFEDQHEP